MSELVTIGDKVSPGRYTVHSRFPKVVNFRFGDELAMVVDEELGAGPVNIVVRGIDLSLVQSLDIEDSTLRIEGYNFSFDSRRRYRSGMDFPNSDLKIFAGNIPVFESALSSFAPCKSLAFLIDSKRKEDFVTSFEIEFVKRIEKGTSMLIAGNIVDAAKIIRGAGPGLTPSGDDFNAGMMIGYKLFEKLMWVDRARLVGDIYSSAIGENIISNTFLKCARDGALAEKQKSLLTAIIFQEKEDVIDTTKQVCRIGETSGADWAVGLLITLKRILV